MNVIRPQVKPTEHELTLLCEQTDYLEGVLWADKAHRMDADPSRDVSNEIDPYGTGTKAFWRGVLETAGYIGLKGGDRQYPRVELAGSYSFLGKFVEFLAEELAGNVYWAESWEQLRFAASGGRVRISGTRAQDVCRLLYVGQEIGQDTIRQRVDAILIWTGKA